MAGEKFRIKNVRSKVELDVTPKEWETIQANDQIAKNYVVVSAPTIKVNKPTTEETK
ncbi:hypothetical protein SMI01S_11710 [Sphingobacterium mizutaii NBRC 14946 = DSM 11724]|uniref:Uncharacterized protein n=2 Tax=Sphingobacterium mizutaii TaxID=1010 RepID=A0AAJ4XCK3_9SPHI|nr:hypothetical protein [Sphingobacterium mizutaii]GEM67565.1 hypothetical protein SMI01S_11710 [Sphingobacterium mizutaii NBRC 14946 = DSM 11724]SDL14328.1 hypothetical protein SAMN05192578_1011505 [Sphingobacterium mizutaii]SNV52115.1 Uncharacterised protein [Sphingobacterium mizutaii]